MHRFCGCFAAALGMLGVGGCGEAPTSTTLALPGLVRDLADYGFADAIDAAGGSVAMLRYRGPDNACPHVYRILTTYSPPLAHEADSTSYLAIAPAPQTGAMSPRTGNASDIYEGLVFYQGIRAEQRGITRDVFMSREFAGPASPTAACTAQTWDPIEDALALAWPRLTGRLTAVDERWNGLRVEGKCNRSACVDPQTGGGGPDHHDRICVTEPWRQRLLGVLDVRGEPLGVIGGTWSDGHPNPDRSLRGPSDRGIWAETTVLVSLAHGRPVWARAVVHHGFPVPVAGNQAAPVVRTWTLEAVDTCPGSLTALGWARDAELTAAVDRTLGQLASADELRQSRTAVPPSAE